MQKAGGGNPNRKKEAQRGCVCLAVVLEKDITGKSTIIVSIGGGGI